MINRREDFEPFVEDDVPFEKHVANLAQPGTFAGNDAIVAFARNNQVNVVIHQLNAPLWQICGTDTSNARELHIAYRYGEHYDSVRKINDNSEAPARLQMEMLSKNESNKKEKIQPKESEDSEEELQDEIEDAVQKVRNATGCLDAALIVQVLESEDYNIESTIFAVLQMNEVKRLYVQEAQEGQANRPKSLPKPALWEENGSGTRIFGSQEIANNKTQLSPTEGNQASRKQTPKVPNKQKKQQRLEKKQRQTDRHRQQVLAGKSNNEDNNSKSEADAEAQVTVVKAVAALNI
ncbi:OTU domain-containing protein 3 isoform X2 [Tiliqua scincoides]